MPASNFRTVLNFFNLFLNFFWMSWSSRTRALTLSSYSSPSHPSHVELHDTAAATRNVGRTECIASAFVSHRACVIATVATNGSACRNVFKCSGSNAALHATAFSIHFGIWSPRPSVRCNKQSWGEAAAAMFKRRERLKQNIYSTFCCIAFSHPAPSTTASVPGTCVV
jgi:hypothetical protein